MMTLTDRLGNDIAGYLQEETPAAAMQKQPQQNDGFFGFLSLSPRSQRHELQQGNMSVEEYHRRNQQFLQSSEQERQRLQKAMRDSSPHRQYVYCSATAFFLLYSIAFLINTILLFHCVLDECHRHHDRIVRAFLRLTTIIGKKIRPRVNQLHTGGAQLSTLVVDPMTNSSSSNSHTRSIRIKSITAEKTLRGRSLIDEAAEIVRSGPLESLVPRVACRQGKYNGQFGETCGVLHVPYTLPFFV
jgi:hypothetical protein